MERFIHKQCCMNSSDSLKETKHVIRVFLSYGLQQLQTALV